MTNNGKTFPMTSKISLRDFRVDWANLWWLHHLASRYINKNRRNPAIFCNPTIHISVLHVNFSSKFTTKLRKAAKSNLAVLRNFADASTFVLLFMFGLLSLSWLYCLYFFVDFFCFLSSFFSWLVFEHSFFLQKGTWNRDDCGSSEYEDFYVFIWTSIDF